MSKYYTITQVVTYTAVIKAEDYDHADFMAVDALQNVDGDEGEITIEENDDE